MRRCLAFTSTYVGGGGRVAGAGGGKTRRKRRARNAQRQGGDGARAVRIERRTGYDWAGARDVMVTIYCSAAAPDEETAKTTAAADTPGKDHAGLPANAAA